jgi:hypothetical protein
MPASISATDLGGSDDDQLPENNLSTDPSDHQLIHEVITSKPLQEEDYRSIVVSDHLIDHPFGKNRKSKCKRLRKIYSQLR